MASSTPEPIDVDARRLALEAIATLVYVKTTAADLILRRAGVSEDLIRRFLKDRDPATGGKRSKRDAGAALLEELDRTGDDQEIVRHIVAIAADWNAFHLSQNEYQARAVVQKALEIKGMLAAADARAVNEAEARRLAEAKERDRRHREDIARQSTLLLAQFDQAAAKGEPHQRGYLLEDLLNRSFDLYGIPVHSTFKRNDGGEQIDGAFELDGWHYIVECRWRQRLPDIRQLDGLSGQIRRSGRQTMGLFLSVEGWSENVVPLLKQNPDKSIILMDGFDFRSVLDLRVNLEALLRAKVKALNFQAEPFISVLQLI